MNKPRDSLGLTRNNLIANRTSTTPPLSPEATIENMRKVCVCVLFLNLLSSNCLQLLELRLSIDFEGADEHRLAEQLADGIHLCNYVNAIRIRSVPTVLSPISSDVSVVLMTRLPYFFQWN